ncbi:penicillin-binding transpeptidase domain-containing protein [Pseudodesulfovibrio senegalensis]|jgi:cell division protein FtsI (penicillin-binding protein 3)|uniref:PASTA domain-containing protein n=1 Tax=Pseudodesulfovibrio senegalensis TaxID=1721087 RepID=A0A6N6N2H2_9BACT|nr:penicillin-binding transpeptidase domain-containing protein [Pseudodesulfovibrio senegalensis]KAB1442141.1 PASTA domain-containing protein [Pseudodesulfovibrio senegalensis]
MTGKTKQGKKDLSKAKIILVMIFFGVALCALWVRAGWVQLHEGEWLEKMAARQNLAAEFESGERGRILDRNGKILATSVEAQSVYLRPMEAAKHKQAVIATLSSVLGISKSNLRKRLRSKRNFIWIKRQITDKQASALLKAKLPGVHLTTEYTRLYPNGHLAGQILGFVGVDGKGLEGIEKRFDKHMTPGKAKFVVQRDASGRRLYLDAQGREVNINGAPVQLTIDRHIQNAAEQALAGAVDEYHGKAGVVVVVEVQSGDILALANYPFFNPNIYRRTKASVRRNRAVTDIFEPGSTMKPLLIAAALQEKVVDPDKLYFCENGRWRVPGKTIRDHHPAAWLPVRKVLRYSSNIGSAKIGMDLGANKYHEYLTALGFGARTGINFPGESSGLVRPPEKWRKLDLAATSFGQSIGVTPLQMAQAFLCLANKGRKKRLNLILDPAAKRDAKDEKQPERIVDADVAQTVLSLMEEVVEMDGTGRKARIQGLTVAGKTGTAQKAVRGGYGDKYLASFVGLVPGDDPEYLVICMVDEPTKNDYGGTVAAPVVRSVMVDTLAYKGQLPDAAGEAMAEELAVASIPSEELAQTLAPAPHKTAGSTIPDLRGMALRRALEILVNKGIVPVLKGDGTTVSRQKPAAGRPWPEAGNTEGKKDVFVLWLS